MGTWPLNKSTKDLLERRINTAPPPSAMDVGLVVGVAAAGVAATLSMSVAAYFWFVRGAETVTQGATKPLLAPTTVAATAATAVTVTAATIPPWTFQTLSVKGKRSCKNSGLRDERLDKQCP